MWSQQLVTLIVTDLLALCIAPKTYKKREGDVCQNPKLDSTIKKRCGAS